MVLYIFVARSCCPAALCGIHFCCWFRYCNAQGGLKSGSRFPWEFLQFRKQLWHGFLSDAVTFDLSLPCLPSTWWLGSFWEVRPYWREWLKVVKYVDSGYLGNKIESLFRASFDSESEVSCKGDRCADSVNSEHISR